MRHLVVHNIRWIYSTVVCVCVFAAAGPQCLPVRQLLQTGARPLTNQALVDGGGIDKQSDAVTRLLASGVADHRLPHMPAQLAKTVDEIECAEPPAAN